MLISRDVFEPQGQHLQVHDRGILRPRTEIFVLEVSSRTSSLGEGTVVVVIVRVIARHGPAVSSSPIFLKTLWLLYLSTNCSQRCCLHNNQYMMSHQVV